MNVAVASSQVLFQKALCALLIQTGRFACVTEHGSGLDLVGMNDKSQPVVLLIHTTDSIAGVESVRELRELHPEARVILLADRPDEKFCERALEAGAWGCLSTTDSPQVLVRAVGKVVEGERWFAHRVTNMIIEELIASRRPDMRLATNLTPREWEVLALLAKGYSDKEVASRLYISSETARSHIKSIYKKLQVSTRRAAAVYYFKQVRCQGGLSRPPEAIAASEIT